MKKIRIGLVGANGRMGKEITALLKNHQRFDSAIAISLQGKTVGFKKAVKSFAEVDSESLDVVIDFSTPDMLKNSVAFCRKNKVPLVCGVTGLSPVEIKELKAAAVKTAILFAPNMSLGVAILKSALSLLANLKDFDFQIVEAHHNMKKDKPSGTAISLQTELERVVRQKVAQPLSIRAGGIIGDHQVIAASENEMIMFEHRAFSRSVFAQGALRAAEWIAKHKNGYFQIEDVLKG